MSDKPRRPAVAQQQYVDDRPRHSTADTPGATEHTIVGERDEGDARWDYPALTYGWFDHFLKGEDNHLLDTLPHVRYYTMGINKWQKSDTWPPKGAAAADLLSDERRPRQHAGQATACWRRRRRGATSPTAFTYDPMKPVPTYGGGFCCMPGSARRVAGSARDGDATGHPGLHVARAQGRDGGERADHQRRSTCPPTARTRISRSVSRTYIPTGGRSTWMRRSSALAIARATTSQSGWSRGRSTR